MTHSSAHPATGPTGAARHALIAAALLGVLADVLLRNEPWGVGLLVWMASFALVVITLARRSERTLSTESITWLSAAVLFAAGLTWRDAETLHAFDVLAMLSALVLLAMTMNAIPVPNLGLARIRDLVVAALGTGLSVAGGVVPLLFRDAELHTVLRPDQEGSAKQLVRALVLATPVVFVFGLLLTRADPVFGSFFAFPDVDIERLFSHILITGFFAWIVAGWLRRAFIMRPEGRTTLSTPFPIALGFTDVTLTLGALSALFAAFVVAQISWLFGGESFVLRTTGLTFANYARRGFFELVAVAGLLLPLLLGVHALIPTSDVRAVRTFRRLALLLVLLLGAILASAGARMRLYIQYYGISVDRLYATAIMLWLAIVFVGLAVTILRARPRTFAWGLVVSAYATLFTLNILNPDAMVARANLARANGQQSGVAGPDFQYLATLGGDAIPLLVTALVAPTAVADSAASLDRCTAARVLLERWTGDRIAQRTSTWTQWNAARVSAARSVAAAEADLAKIACAKAPTNPVTTPAGSP